MSPLRFPALPNVHSGKMHLLWRQFSRSCMPGRTSRLAATVRRHSQHKAFGVSEDARGRGRVQLRLRVRLRRTSIPAEWTYLTMATVSRFLCCEGQETRVKQRKPRTTERSESLGLRDKMALSSYNRDWFPSDTKTAAAGVPVPVLKCA